MAIEEFEFVVFPVEKLTEAATGKWFRDAAEKAGLARAGLAPLPHAVNKWKKVSRLLLSGGAVLGQAAFAEEADDESWAMSLYYLDYGTRAGVVGSVPPWPFDASGRSKVWPWLTAFLEGFVQATSVDVGAVNGSGDADRDDEGLPTDDELAMPLPRAVTPWMYVGSSRLTAGLRRGLKELPAFSSHPLADGWLLRPVEYFSDPLPKKFVPVYRELTGGPVRWLRGALKPPPRARATRSERSAAKKR